MGTFRITLTYATEFRLRPDIHDATGFIAALKDERGPKTHREQGYTVDATVTQDERSVYVRVDFSASMEEASVERYRQPLQALLDRLEGIVDTLAGHRDREREPFPDDPREALWRRIRQTTPQVTARVPLLAGDREAVMNSDAAKGSVIASVRETVDFWEDQQRILAAIQVRLDRDALEITAASAAATVEAGAAYLSARRRRANPWESLRPRPVWAIGSVAIALLSFGMSWAPLTWATLSVFTFLATLIGVAAVLLARRLRAKPLVTAWGMAPILTLCAFAFAYGASALADPAVIELNRARLRFLREPFLLSLSLLSTVGVLDLRLNGWVRSLAYLEMILVASLAGGAAITVARRVSRRADEIANQLRIEREG